MNDGRKRFVRRLELWLAVDTLDRDLASAVVENRRDVIAEALLEFGSRQRQTWETRERRACLDAVLAVEPPLLPDDLDAELRRWQHGIWAQLGEQLADARAGTREGKIEALIVSGATEGERDAARRALTRIRGSA